jgi:TetR/AcrR family transcriptional regulator, regulator of mycofactocin system
LDDVSEAVAASRLPEILALQRRTTVMAAIEEAALELLARHKMADVTVEEIAEKAGVGLRTLYRYFPSKYAILAAYPHRESARLANLIKQRPETESPFIALRNGFVEAYDIVDPAENNRWLAAISNSVSVDRPALTALRATADAISGALAERMGSAADELWPSVAGTIAAAAIEAGSRRWFATEGDYLECVLAALDVARFGLEPEGRGAVPARRRQRPKPVSSPPSETS